MPMRTIVVIEDDAAQRLDIVATLEAARLDVVWFEDGDRALEHIRRNRGEISAVFTDIGLATDTTGLDVARLVMEAFPEIVVIVTSGALSKRPEHLGERARFLVKPWRALDVMNAIVDAAQEE